MRMLLVVGVVAMVIGSCVSAAAQQSAPPKTPSVEIEGVYRITGTDVGGKAYTGLVKIIKVGETYQLGWTGPNGGGFTQVGVGIRVGDVLSVGFYGNNLPAGIIIFHIKGLQMTGEWTVLGSDKLYQENLTKLNQAELDKLQEQESKPEPRPNPRNQKPTQSIKGLFSNIEVA